MAGWLMATLRRYVGHDAYVDNPAHLYLTLHPQIRPAILLVGAGMRSATVTPGLVRESAASLPRDTESPSQRNDRTHHFGNGDHPPLQYK